MGATAAESLIDNAAASENLIDNTAAEKKEPNYKSIFDCSFESKPFYTDVWYFIRILLGLFLLLLIKN